jgi:hypothetical protein
MPLCERSDPRLGSAIGLSVDSGAKYLCIATGYAECGQCDKMGEI